MITKNTLRMFLIALLIIGGTFHISPRTTAQDTVTFLLNSINGLRGNLGLSPYSLNGTLSIAAQNQASWMVQTGQISHNQTDGSTPRSRALAAGYQSSWVSENIYMGTSATAQSAWQWWLNSPIHYRGITSATYSEIGIASASGTHGQAFVLVFGNPSGTWTQPTSNNNSEANSSSGSSGASGQPPYVVGIDNVGNIMHEVQAGHTLGEIALIYGYTWDDLQYIRDLNDMTEPEGRNLEIGTVILVPPYEGTYTPTPIPVDFTPPAPESLVEIESDDLQRASVLVSTAEATAELIPASPTPSLTPLPTEADAGVIITSAVVPEWAVQTDTAEDITTLTAAPSTAWQAMTVTPQPTQVAMVVDPENPDTASLIEPAMVNVTADNTGDDGGSDNTTSLLYVAIALQAVIIVGAGVAFWRQNRKSV